MTSSGRYTVQRTHDGACPLHLVMDVTHARPRPVIALSADQPESETQAAALVEELSVLDAQIQALQQQRRAALARVAARPGNRRPMPQPAASIPRDNSKAAMMVRRQMAGLTLPEALHLLESQGWSWKLIGERQPDGQIVYLARVFRAGLGCHGRKMADHLPVTALTEAWASAEQLFNSRAWLEAQRTSLAGLTPEWNAGVPSSTHPVKETT